MSLCRVFWRGTVTADFKHFTHMSKQKPKSLTFKDAFLFGVAMCNEEVCRGVPEQALEAEIEQIFIDKEKCIIYNPEYRGIRLDIIVKDYHQTRH